MRFAGIDIGAERHMVAVLDEQGEVLCRSSPFGEDASGYARLFELLGPSADCLVALEATGHYWRNLFVALIAKDYAVAVLNPLRTARFAEEELRRTKTDAIDALGIARFAQQKRPRVAQLPDSVTEELRELERLRERVAEDFADRLRQLHRAVDLGFPEFTRYVRTLESQLAATILSRYPTAASFRGVSVKKLARIVYDGSHKIGEELARNFCDPARERAAAKALGMPVLTAVRLNPQLRAYYDRLVSSGKPRKVALSAAMRKLLGAVSSVATNRVPFVPQMTSTPCRIDIEYNRIAKSCPTPLITLSRQL